MKAIAVLLGIALIASMAFGGPFRWTPTGPGVVGAVSRVFASPFDANQAYAWTSAGLFATSDGGSNWLPANNGLPAGALNNAAFSGLVMISEKTLVLAIYDSVFRSDDGGVNWSFAGSPNVPITALGYDAQSQTLLAGANGDGGIFTSRDDGRTWLKSKVPDSITHLLTIDYFVVTSSRLFAVGGAGIVVLSTGDEGQTWQSFKTPVSALYGEPSSSRLFALRNDRKTLMVSSDGGARWSNLPALPWSGLGRVIPSGDSVFATSLAGIFSYTTGASSWRNIGSTVVNDLSINSSLPRHFYAAATAGITTYIEGGTWTPKNAGLPGPYSTDLSIAASQPSTVYATTVAGVFRTTNSGDSWSLVNENAIGSHVVVSPASPDTAYFVAGIAYKTSDGGSTWTRITTDSTSDLAVAPSDPKTIYAMLSTRLARSDDGGSTFHDLVIPFSGYYYYSTVATSLAVDPSDPDHVLIALSDGIYQVKDGGTQMSASTPNVRSLCFAPGDSSRVFGAASRLITSSDGGRSWAIGGLVDKAVIGVAVSPTSVFAGTTDGHLYRSDDYGQSWIGMDDGFYGVVSSIAVDPSGKHLFAATTAGIYQYGIVNPDVDVSPIPSRLPSAIDSASTGSGFVIPIVGRTFGASGALFTTELTLQNEGETAQDVMITRLPGGESYRLTVPPGGVKFVDVAKTLKMLGIGTLVVEGSVNASTRIWSLPPDGRAPVSQSIPIANTAVLTVHSHAQASGLEHDDQFRTNAGIVNLSGEAHQFTIQIAGDRASSSVTVEVPAFSLLQLALPENIYGHLTLDGFADAGARWLLYGSSINRSNGDAKTSLGTVVE